MKKTLAILLALLMAGSVILVSCDNGGREPVQDGAGDANNDYIESDESDSTTNTESNNNTESESQTSGNNNNNNNNHGWNVTNETVYAGVNFTLRSDANESSNSLTDKKVPFGTALTRVETNGTWSKVKVSGSDTIYYVKNIYLSVNSGNFTFTDSENSITLNPETDNNVCFYYSPFYSDDGETNYANMLCSSGIKVAHLSADYTLTKKGVSTNGSWVKVTFVGTVTISTTNTKTYTAENPGTFYIQANAFNRKDIVDSTWSNGNGGDGYFS